MGYLTASPRCKENIFMHVLTTLTLFCQFYIFCIHPWLLLYTAAWNIIFFIIFTWKFCRNSNALRMTGILCIKQYLVVGVLLIWASLLKKLLEFSDGNQVIGWWQWGFSHKSALSTIQQTWNYAQLFSASLKKNVCLAVSHLLLLQLELYHFFSWNFDFCHAILSISVCTSME